MIAAVLESIDHMFGPEGELGKPLQGVARPAIDAVYTYHQENYSETCSESDRRRLSASYMLGSRKLALCPLMHLLCRQLRSSRRLLWYAFIAAGLCVIPFATMAESLALDGDDIIIDGQDYRLEGVDAFEGDQVCQAPQGQVSRCGDEARAALAAILAGKTLTCVPTGKRHRNRLIANCTAGTLDVQAELVRSGWAFVRPDFLSPARAAALCAVEAEAKARNAGAWAGEFELPYFQKGGRRKSRDEVSCPP